MKLVKGENEDADEQDKKLHWDLHQSVHYQSEPALGDGFSCQVASYLRLICSEIRELQEESADYARPYIIPVIPIEFKIDQVHLLHFSRDVERPAETRTGGKHAKDHPRGYDQSGEDDAHLQELCI